MKSASETECNTASSFILEYIMNGGG